MEDVWLQAQSNLAKVLTHQTFTTWIEPIRFAGAHKNTILLEAPNQFIRDRVRESYLPMILESVRSITDSHFQVELQVAARQQEKAPKSTRKSRAEDELQPVDTEKSAPAEFSTNLNTKYTFDTFVCGGSNQFAHAAAQSVANNPAGKYNPLFIYGGVGLGKTHLLTAIGNQVLAKNRKARVCFYTSEKFMNELINCLRYQKMDQFRNKFRKMDLLLIDDIQFIAGKERTQEEFFHTFNAPAWRSGSAPASSGGSSPTSSRRTPRQRWLFSARRPIPTASGSPTTWRSSSPPALAPTYGNWRGC
jgi:chromosomal replication initiator protein